MAVDVGPLQIYLASVMHNRYYGDSRRTKNMTEHEKQILRTTPNCLESYHYYNTDTGMLAYNEDQHRDYGIEVFLDSGAFSADSLGATITVDEYCTWLQRHQHLVRRVDGVPLQAGLDVIDTKNADGALATYQHQWRAENEYGLYLIPVFHFGEDWRWLDHYASNYPYIGLGGLVTGQGSDNARNTAWLDRCWDMLTDAHGRPLVKVHGFAVAGRTKLERYPWASCDASSWLKIATHGNIALHDWGKVLAVSGNSPARKEAGQHLLSLRDRERDEIVAHIERHGFEPGRLMEHYQSRVAWNVAQFRSLQDRINANLGPDRRFVPEQGGLF